MSVLIFAKQIAQELSLQEWQVSNVLELFEEGATIPFISRYRKERTGSLDEVEVGAIEAAQKRLEELEKRRTAILKSIEEQGKLSPELKAQIETATTLTALEDLYLPYKRSRKTRASMAREKGLEPLATWLLEHQNSSAVEAEAAKFLNEQVGSNADALQGARDIIAELVSENLEVRQLVRKEFERKATLKSKVARGKDDENSKYRDYFDFEEQLSKSPSHRVLAIFRAEEEGILRVNVEPPEEEVIVLVQNLFVKGRGAAAEQVREAVGDSYKRLLSASIETEFRNLTKTKADTEAIGVFAENLRQLLLAAPLGQQRILAIDPGFRTGCKVVCLNETGALLHHDVIYPHEPQNHFAEAKQKLETLIARFQINAIAIGNGTASRETEALARKLQTAKPVEVFVVSEQGASIYSASEAAREEFADYDLTVRGSVSIGRRLMDPLAELVKIDPKSIGVGQYQHDVDQKILRENLDKVVESCVNKVGVDINTASKHLLTYISGLGEKLAQNIVDYRNENGSFSAKTQLLKVGRMGAKAFEQSAGFLRVRNGKNPLDNTAVHPERYDLVAEIAKDMNCSIEDLIAKESLRKAIPLQKYVTKDVGLPTLTDIIQELAKHGRDPRGKAASFSFDERVKTIDDVKTGMILAGIVTNITKFGAFVDIGTKENGLVHVSQITNRFITDPAEVLKLHQHVEVRVMEVDYNRKRIQLSMKEV